MLNLLGHKVVKIKLQSPSKKHSDDVYNTFLRKNEVELTGAIKISKKKK